MVHLSYLETKHITAERQLADKATDCALVAQLAADQAQLATDRELLAEQFAAESQIAAR